MLLKKVYVKFILSDLLKESETKHMTHREYRTNHVKTGKIASAFLWDRGHKDGPEYHIITTTGLIFIVNQYTKKLITILVARPGQIRRYYENCHVPVPEYLMKQAMSHQKRRLNK